MGQNQGAQTQDPQESNSTLTLRMRVILDTNVLLSAFIRVDSNPYVVLHAWLDGRFELVSSGAQIEEITRVARYPQVRR